MIFDVLKSTIQFSKEGDSTGSVSVNFEVVPKDQEYLDIGDEYILCGSGYLPMRDKTRQPVVATVNVSSDPEKIAHIKGDRPICGYAHFFPERRHDLDAESPKLMCSVVIEPNAFAEMLRARVTAPGSATLCLAIEGLEFGWEPDGSHQIWNLDDSSDCEHAARRRITSFWFNVETFWTSEGAIREEEDRKTNTWLADSPNPEDRKLAASAQEAVNPDPVAKLLAECRGLLWAILGLGVVALVLLNR